MNSDRQERVERRLAAILAADVVGYSRLMGADEEGTLAALKKLRRELCDPKIAEHRGRIVKTTGDGLLVEFGSVVDAVRCAAEVQQAMAGRNAGIPEARRIEFRVGINLGDIILDEGDIYGDGVNVAARLEALAAPGGICVSRVVRDQVRDKLDVVFEDLGERQVKNIARPVRVFRVALTHPGARAPGSTLSRNAGEGAEGRSPKAGEESPPTPALPDKPSLAVLPFQNMSGDPEQEYFADGMVEEITTAIARLPWLFVIARNSSFTYKGKAVDIKQMARELGVRYVLEGSVRKSGDRVRITGQLIDTATDAHIWADRFDGALDDVFDLQDRVAASVVGAIEPKLLGAETERAIRKPTESLDAYDLYLRASAQFQKFTQPGWDAAIALLKKALAIDPSYAPAAAAVGFCRMLQAISGLPVAAPDITEAVRLARAAVGTGKDQPDALWMAAFTLSLFTGAHATAAGMVEHALALNPNSAYAWCIRGFVAAFQDQADPAIEALQHAMRLSPLDPQRWYFFTGMAMAHLAARRFEETIDWADRALREQPRMANVHRSKAVACAHLGRVEEAGVAVRRMLELQPTFTISEWRRTHGAAMFSPETLALYVDGLKKAGLPEA